MVNEIEKENLDVQLASVRLVWDAYEEMAGDSYPLYTAPENIGAM